MPRSPLAAFITSLFLASLACSTGFPTAPHQVATGSPEPAFTPQVDDVASLGDLDEPPAWLEEMLADQPEAPEPDPLQLSFEVIPEPSVEQTVGEAGATLELQADNGVTYTLDIPQGALLSEANISMTQVHSVEDATVDGESLAAVELGPEGLVLVKPAKLRIALPPQSDLQGHLGFSAGGDGENAHALMAVESDGAFDIGVPHFSMYGTVSGRHSNNARLLRAAISNSTPNGAAEYYNQDIAKVWADYLDDKLSVELFAQILTEDKREWFWRPGDGVYYSLLDGAVRTVNADTNRIERLDLLERAIAHYIEWNHIQTPTLRDYYLTAIGGRYPFEVEEALANRNITQGIKEGLEAECWRPIDALYKIRIYRLGLALNSDDSREGVKPYSATTFPNFTQAYALEKVQECANFKLDFTTYLSIELRTGRWQETGIVKDLPYVYGENFEVKVFSFETPREHWSTRGLACEGGDGFITFSDILWPLNISKDPRAAFQDQPLEIRVKVVEPPTVICGALPLPPFWVLNRFLQCPLRFKMDVASRIDRDNADFIQQYRCEFKDPDGNPGVFRDEVFLNHDPQFSIFP